MGNTIGPKAPSVPSVSTPDIGESKLPNTVASPNTPQVAPGQQKRMDEAARKGAEENAGMQKFSGQLKNQDLQSKLDAEEKALKAYKAQQAKVHDMELAVERMPGVLREGGEKLLDIERKKLRDLGKEHDRRVEDSIGPRPKYDPRVAPQRPAQPPGPPMSPREKMQHDMMIEMVRKIR